ncbi:hypothetical protein [Noviherbaspirillum aerium]|uniref:hypothetical protein n=1 Tax=Noviherbaspirillum aerium TaxID=2588497 RepID=UPI00124CA948|nr:hypothetical protein [Noviherbaspirillum aerium]
MISLELKAADEKLVTDRLSEYGLSIIERSTLNPIEDRPALTFLIVEVPTLFEEQWVEVLRKEPSVSGAWTNDIYYLP